MAVPLSVLDLSPVWKGGTPAQAVRDTLSLAESADELGFHRFWVAEHHSLDTVGSASPEVLISAITQRTQRIRIGSGGVMLVNHSPLKVAEQFMSLEALAPGRIDLGVGRALGADMRTGGALGSAGSEAFPQYFALLSAWLLDASGQEPLGERHPARGIFAQPRGPSHPDLFILCTSEDSARFAAMAGVGMVFAEFIARRTAESAIAAYYEAFQPSAFREQPLAAIALSALAADTTEAALRLDAPRRASSLARSRGLHPERLDPDEALAVLDAAGGWTDAPGTVIVGDGPAVREALQAKARAVGADELFLLNLAPTVDDRRRSLELIAGA